MRETDRPIFEAPLEWLATGLAPGPERLSVPLWELSYGVEFDAYGLHTAMGMEVIEYSEALFDSAAGMFDDAEGLFDDGAGAVVEPWSIGETTPITGLGQARQSNAARLVFAGTGDKLFIYNGSSTDEVGSGFTHYDDEAASRIATRWSMQNWGDWNLATNGIDKPQVWKGSGSYEDLQGVNFLWAEIVRTLGPHVIFLNTQNGQHRIEWSAEGNPEGWDPLVYPTAGALNLRGLKSPIIAAEPLGINGLGIYSSATMHVAQYLGNTFVIGALPAVEGVGAVSKNSIIPVGSLHYGIMQEGIFRTDGVSKSIISYPKLGQWLQQNVNWEQSSKIAGIHLAQKEQVRWSFPEIGQTSNSKTLVYNYRTNAFWFLNQAFSVAVRQETFQWPLFGNNSGLVLFGEKSRGINGGAFARRAQTIPLDFRMRNRWKYLDVVQVELAGANAANLTLSVGTQQSPNDPVVWSAAYSLDPGLEMFSIRESGVFFTFRFESTGANDDWLISNFKVFGAVDGGDW